MDSVTAVIPDIDSGLEQAIRNALDDIECAMCDTLAVVYFVTRPCNHHHPLCAVHRALVLRLVLLRESCGSKSQCAECHGPVERINLVPL